MGAAGRRRALVAVPAELLHRAHRAAVRRRARARCLMATKSELLARVPPLYRLGRAREGSAGARTPITATTSIARCLRDVATRSRLACARRDRHVHGRDGMGASPRLRPHRDDRARADARAPCTDPLRERRGDVHVHEGDSADGAADRFSTALDEPALFWLDAHPEHRSERRETGRSRSRAELAAIARATRSPAMSCSSTTCNTRVSPAFRPSTSSPYRAIGSRTSAASRLADTGVERGGAVRHARDGELAPRALAPARPSSGGRAPARSRPRARRRRRAGRARRSRRRRRAPAAS